MMLVLDLCTATTLTRFIFVLYHLIKQKTTPRWLSFTQILLLKLIRLLHFLLEKELFASGFLAEKSFLFHRLLVFPEIFNPPVNSFCQPAKDAGLFYADPRWSLHFLRWAIPSLLIIFVCGHWPKTKELLELLLLLLLLLLFTIWFISSLKGI